MAKHLYEPRTANQRAGFRYRAYGRSLSFEGGAVCEGDVCGRLDTFGGVSTTVEVGDDRVSFNPSSAATLIKISSLTVSLPVSRA